MYGKLKEKIFSSSGFSLVELVVVMAIMVVLTAMLLPSLASQVDKSVIATNTSKASAIYDAALVASTRNILATSDFDTRAAYLSAPSSNKVSIAAHLEGEISKSADDTATVWFDPAFIKVICVDYCVDGVHYVNPPAFAVNSDPRKRSMGISEEAVSAGSGGVPSDSKSVTVSSE